MNGALDVPGYREIASVLHREIPGARRQEFPDAGHLLNLERPARFNEDAAELPGVATHPFWIIGGYPADTRQSTGRSASPNPALWFLSVATR